MRVGGLGRSLGGGADDFSSEGFHDENLLVGHLLRKDNDAPVALYRASKGKADPSVAGRGLYDAISGFETARLGQEQNTMK